MEDLQKLGLGAALYFIATTAIALTIGILVVTAIEPGNLIDGSLIRESFDLEEMETVEQSDLAVSDIRNNFV